MDRLRDRVILITGSTGIAAATASRAVAEGASVFIVSRDPAHAGGLAESLAADPASSESRIGWAAADLAVEDEVDTAVQAAVDRFGRIDGFFSVAGGSGRRFGDGPIHTLTAEAWAATADLNLRTQVLTCARVVREMRRQSPNAS